MSAASPRPKVLLAIHSHLYETMFSPTDRERLFALADVLNPQPPKEATAEFVTANIPGADVAITSWGSPRFEGEVLGAADSLKVICHAGGSVRPHVSEEFWARGLQITSAAAAISLGVAEFCLGLILTATKRAFWLGLETRNGHWHEAGVLYGGWSEIYQQRIGIIGAGFVGRHLAKLLSNFTCEICFYDPYLTHEAAAEMGATKLDTLEELFSSCKVVSLNAPTTPETVGMLRGEHFALLQPGALFINTARSILINEDEFLAEVRKGRFVACIDVTNIEPPALDYPLRNLPNVWLTPHIAGTVAENKLRIGTLVVDEIELLVKGEPYRFEVTEQALRTMA